MLHMFKYKPDLSNAFDHQKQKTYYIPYDQITPGQIRYSQYNTNDKIEKLKSKNSVTWDDNHKCWRFKYHNGTSVLSKKHVLPVVMTSFGYVLMDGHHDVMSSIAIGAKMIPIKIQEDLRHLSTDEFWKYAEENAYAYLFKTNGEKSVPPSSFSELIDDPNRYFAAITARKYSDKDNSRGAEFPLWIKIGKDKPFIELKIADALFANGFIYDPIKMGNPPDDKTIDQARAILLKANIPDLHLVTTRMHYQQFNVNFEHNSMRSSLTTKDSHQITKYCR